MTENSYICNIINEHPNWEEYMDKRYPDIRRIKADDLNYSIDSINQMDYLADCPYCMFKYAIGANFKDPVVQEARGIIINTKTKEVVSWPFRKFGDYTESYADDIDWSTAEVQEKIDGALIQLWWDDFLNKWSFSTSGVIYAKNAPTGNSEFKNFENLIMSTEEYSIIMELINARSLDKDITYLFELESPYIKGPVIPCEETRLTHIGSRNKKTGQELKVTLPGIRKPFVYPIESLEECIEVLSDLEEFNKDWDKEGFVVCDANFNRNKVKPAVYKIAKHINDSDNTKIIKMILKMINDGTLQSEKIPKSYKSIIRIIKYYEFRVLEFYHNAECTLRDARVIYQNSPDGDLSFVHKFLKDNPYSSIIYKGIKTESDRKKSIDEIIRECKRVENLLFKLIPSYRECAVFQTGKNYLYCFMCEQGLVK